MLIVSISIHPFLFKLALLKLFELPLLLLRLALWLAVLGLNLQRCVSIAAKQNTSSIRGKVKEELLPALIQGEKKKGAGGKEEAERQDEKDSVEEQSSQ